MDFKETLNSIKSKIQAKITPEMSAEELENWNGILGEIDSLQESHNKVVTSEATLKDIVVRMVQTQGNADKPRDASTESKPMSIDECVSEVLNKGGK